LFAAVVELPPAERRRYLDEHCPDLPLRRRVERLLAADAAVRHEPTPSASGRPETGGGWEPGKPADFPALPGYEIIARLGEGGMGVVYKAWQVNLKRVVAVKMIRAGVEADAERRGRFRTEAEAVARIQHPNIVQVFEVGEHDGRLFLSLE